MGPMRISLPGSRSYSRHGDLKALRVHQETLPDHAVGHFAADLLVCPAEDAGHIGLADYPGEEPGLIHRRHPADRAVVHEESSVHRL